jgi:hypothetical protein
LNKDIKKHRLFSGALKAISKSFLLAPLLSIDHLIPHPLLLKEKGWKNKKISIIAPLLKERGWGEVLNITLYSAKDSHPATR